MKCSSSKLPRGREKKVRVLATAVLRVVQQLRASGNMVPEQFWQCERYQ